MIWNPWHGCHKKSAGCLNCYMFRRDSLYNKDSNIITKTKDFNLAIKKHHDGSYYIKDGEIVYTCMTSDFFLEEADAWRNEIWQMIKNRNKVHFYIITKRIERFKNCLPDDWDNGYDNVTICATCENQAMADERIPILLNLPIKHREIIAEPILEKINIANYLQRNLIEQVTVGGESGDKARVCNYDWVLNLKNQCLKYQVPFYFKQTGANFVMQGKLYKIPRKEQLKQADKAGISTI